MHRVFQALLVLATIAVSWLAMLALHELGHVLMGWLTGARGPTVVLPLFGISRTEFAHNPHPLAVAWGGALFGCLLPMALFAAARCFATKQNVFLLAWLTGFCLIANGGYLLGGVILTGSGDDGSVILQHGGLRWQLLTFGVMAIAGGLCLWNGLGPSFGLGVSRGRVSRKAAIGVATLLLLIVCVGLLFNPR
jgi:hypothetical protein